MFVLTIDRRGSRRAHDSADMRTHRDRCRATLPRPVLDWQISAGDELQALYDRPEHVLAAVLALADERDWHVGLGVGPVDEPLPREVREATGAAFVAAREAVTAAKESGGPAVRGSEWARHVEAVLALMCAVRRRRTGPGEQAAELAERGHTQQHMARELGISQSSVSRRLSSALWAQEHGVHPTLVALLRLADGRDAHTASDADGSPEKSSAIEAVEPTDKPASSPRSGSGAP